MPKGSADWRRISILMTLCGYKSCSITGNGNRLVHSVWPVFVVVLYDKNIDVRKFKATYCYCITLWSYMKRRNLFGFCIGICLMDHLLNLWLLIIICCLSIFLNSKGPHIVPDLFLTKSVMTWNSNFKKVTNNREESDISEA